MFKIQLLPILSTKSHFQDYMDVEMSLKAIGGNKFKGFSV